MDYSADLSKNRVKIDVYKDVYKLVYKRKMPMYTMYTNFLALYTLLYTP